MDGYCEADEYGNSNDFETDEIWSENVRCSLNIKPRFQAQSGVVNFGKLFTETYEQKFCLREEFRVRTFVAIQDEIRSRAL